MLPNRFGDCKIRPLIDAHYQVGALGGEVRVGLAGMNLPLAEVAAIKDRSEAYFPKALKYACHSRLAR
jgi:hypothetical protein